MDHKQYLTDSNIRIACQVLQALDIEAEDFYLKYHKDEVEEEFIASENEVMVMSESLRENLPAQILLVNSHGNRAMITTFCNLLISMNRQDLAQICVEERFNEME